MRRPAHVASSTKSLGSLRERLLELAPPGSSDSGVSRDGGSYLDALTQQSQDALHRLETLSKSLVVTEETQADAA